MRKGPIRPRPPETGSGPEAGRSGTFGPVPPLGVTIEADIVRQKRPEDNGGHRAGGGASACQGDLAQAVRTAVVDKRAGGTGLITGRKAFQRPSGEGIELLHAVQDVYLDESSTIA